MPKSFPFRPALILGFVGFVTSFGAHIVAVNLPVYAEQVGVGVAMIGLLIAAYDLAELVAKPVFGALADQRGMKPTMLAGIVVFTLASLAYPLLNNPQLLIVVRFAQGAGAAALSAVSLALVGAYYTERRGRAFGIYNAIKGAGYVVSPLVGTAIVAQGDFAAVFIAAATIGAAAFVMSLFLPQTAKEAEKNLNHRVTMNRGTHRWRKTRGLNPAFCKINATQYTGTHRWRKTRGLNPLLGCSPVRIYRAGTEDTEKDSIFRGDAKKARDVSGLDDDDDDFSLASLRAVFRQRELWPWYTVIVVNMFFVGVLFGFLPVRVHDLHEDALTTGILLTCASASYLLIQPVAGLLADRVGAAATLRVGPIVSGLAILLIPFTEGVALAAVTIIAGCAIGSVWTNSDALMAGLAESGKLGATMGAAGSFKELGDMLGPLVIGALAQAFGLTAGFVICGLLGLAAVAFIRSNPPASGDHSAPGTPHRYIKPL